MRIDTGHVSPRADKRAARIQGLDLIRGLAVALVIVRHCWPTSPMSSGGVVGVVMFFTLSGFLITGILLSDTERFSRVRYARFYRNRTIRLLPALLALLAAVVVVSLTLDLAGDTKYLGRTLFAALTYTTNLPYFHGSEAIDHLWTLATEEQFYLVWPIVMMLGIRWRRLGLLTVILAGLVVALLISSIAFTPATSLGVYPLPTSWALCMLIGATARLYQPRLMQAISTLRVSPRSLALGSVLFLAAMTYVPEEKHAYWTYLALGPAIAAVTATLIVYLSGWKTIPTAWLKPLLALGTISYGAYLWNYAIVVWLGGMSRMTLALGLESAALTIVAATVSWYLVEKPFHRLRQILDRRGPAPASATMLSQK